MWEVHLVPCARWNRDSQRLHRVMLAMLHHHQRRVTPSRSNDQNLGGTERHFCARSEGRKWPPFAGFVRNTIIPWVGRLEHGDGE